MTVILNIVTVIPILGVDLLSNVLGDVVVDYPTLVRIELVHFTSSLFVTVVVSLVVDSQKC